MCALPTAATPESYLRYEMARELADLCPPALGQEIALTGSASRGVADSDSDVEINFWVAELTSPDKRAEWLRGIGAHEVALDEGAIETGSIWATFVFRGLWIEAGWQTITSCERLLRAILAAEVVDHIRLIMADAVAHAVSLRSTGLLSQWQNSLSDYPDALQATLIRNAAGSWMFPHYVSARWASLRRSDPLAVAHRLVRDVHAVLRILFALNRRWEPDWKWLSASAQRLTVKPDHLVECINDIFTMPQSEKTVRTCMELVRDTLELVPPPHDVSKALGTIRDSLADNTLTR